MRLIGTAIVVGFIALLFVSIAFGEIRTFGAKCYTTEDMKTEAGKIAEAEEVEVEFKHYSPKDMKRFKDWLVFRDLEVPLVAPAREMASMRVRNSPRFPSVAHTFFAEGGCAIFSVSIKNHTFDEMLVEIGLSDI